MRITPLLAALALGSVPASAEWHAPAPLAETVSLSSAPATHRVPLQVVILRGSRWTQDAVELRVAKTKEILAQCGVRLDPTIVELASPSGSPSVLYERGNDLDKTSLRVVSQTLSQAKPTIFFVEGFSDNSAQGGTSRPPLTSEGLPEVDTAWIPYSEQPPGWQVSYHVDAHELVHVLANVGHWSPPYQSPPGRKKDDPPDPNAPDPGLMVGNPGIRTNALAPHLCERIKRHPRAAPLQPR